MECPLCDNKSVDLKEEEVERRYKGKNLIVNERYYKCPSCEFEFTNTEIDELNIQEVKKAYEAMLDKLIELMQTR